MDNTMTVALIAFIISYIAWISMIIFICKDLDSFNFETFLDVVGVTGFISFAIFIFIFIPVCLILDAHHLI